MAGAGPSMSIIVTGANGQLGMELRELSPLYHHFDFIFLSRQELAIENAKAVNQFFKKHRPLYCINCAAYTAVDKAETEKEQAFLINAGAAGILATACKENQSRLIHISTDYVFDGTAMTPYQVDSPTKPQGVYGASKLEGERLAMQNDPDTIIIRTAWVYSEFGKNFVKTMLRLMNEKEEINVVSDQIGSPTYAADLAEIILQIVSYLPTPEPITNKSELPVPGTAPHAGIYHFSNEGIISWYDFALAIKELSGSTCKVNPIPTSQYPTPAKRPAYSVLDKTRIQQAFDVEIKDWKKSLAVCMEKIFNSPS
jgi:dTDP-4-dehydrorhamnose reductase